MKTYEKVEVQLHAFLIEALDAFGPVKEESADFVGNAATKGNTPGWFTHIHLGTILGMKGDNTSASPYTIITFKTTTSLF